MKFMINVFSNISARILPNKLLVFTLLGYAIVLYSWLPQIELHERHSGLVNLQSNYYFRPYLSEYIVDFLLVNVESFATKLITVVIIPLIVFTVTAQIFMRFIRANWAVLLSLVAISFLEDYPVRVFLIELFNGELNIPKNSFPIIMHAPFPSFSIALSVVAFSICSAQQHVSPTRAFICTFFISLIFYVHALTSAFLLIFWVIQYWIRALKQSKKVSTANLAVLVQILFYTILVSYSVINADFTVNTNSTKFVTPYYGVLYWIIPLSCLTILIYFKRIDWRDPLFRFTPIFIVMGAEICLSFSILFGIITINFDYIYMGIGQFFLHPLYYIPAINYLMRQSHEYQVKKKGDVRLINLLSLIYHSPVTIEKIVIIPSITLLLLYQCKWFLEMQTI